MRVFYRILPMLTSIGLFIGILVYLKNWFSVLNLINLY